MLFHEGEILTLVSITLTLGYLCNWSTYKLRRLATQLTGTPSSAKYDVERVFMGSCTCNLQLPGIHATTTCNATDRRRKYLTLSDICD